MYPGKLALFDRVCLIRTDNVSGFIEGRQMSVKYWLTVAAVGLFDAKRDWSDG